MPHHKCQYRNCVNNSEDMSMFRFPVNDEPRLKLWVQHSGNKKLKSLTQEEWQRRRLYLCENHFKVEDIGRNTFRSRLVSTAVPLSASEKPRQVRSDIKHTYKPRPKVSKEPVMSKEDTPPLNNEDPIPDMVPKPEMPVDVPAVSELPVLQEVPIEPHIPKDEPMDDEYDMNNNCCKDCAAFTDGFPFWCVECGRGPLCASCAECAPHDGHFLLRTPRGAPRSQTLAVLAVIKQQLQAENLLELYEVSDDGVKMEIKEEPEEFLSPEPSAPGPEPLDPKHPLATYPGTSEQVGVHELQRYKEVQPIPNYPRKIQSTTVIQDTPSPKTVLDPKGGLKFAPKSQDNKISDQTVEEYLAKRRLYIPEIANIPMSSKVAPKRSRYQLDTNETVRDYLAKSYLPVPETGP
ncbi:uncharacterized protein LOC125237392 isoform X13 [Leguminivora glycinivorella]|uniref:uncharacterized protein LOC125237392 isoform X13 n=1 Tax=Leguminivora glycinivorella TaxID=1035111 RepID=UPI00200E393C|nr:uncharacterized protein LOC125237392 isoform X13 [Leguminivora glycinivorella]